MDTRENVFGLSDTQLMIRETARRIAQDKMKPLRAELDRTGEFPWPMVKALRETELWSLYIPAEFGGGGLGTLETCLVMEELSSVCGGMAISFGATALGCYPLLLHATEAQKKKFLPRIAEKGQLAAFALTESCAGSDAGALRTTAKKKDGKYVLNGTKQWITNGEVADLYIVIASTDPEKKVKGLSAFLVEKGTPGFSIGKKADKLGIRASWTTELHFENCEIPAENRIDEEGTGFRIAMRTLDKARPSVAAQAVGIAQGALTEALQYAKVREQFGAAIAALQGVQFMLADMATAVESARALVYACARFIDQGGKEISKLAAMSKLYASDVAMKVTTDAVQILGGYGYMKEYPVEKMMRDAKITQIYEGTNQIQRLVIAGRLLKED